MDRLRIIVYDITNKEDLDETLSYIKDTDNIFLYSQKGIPFNSKYNVISNLSKAFVDITADGYTLFIRCKDGINLPLLKKNLDDSFDSLFFDEKINYPNDFKVFYKSDFDVFYLRNINYIRNAIVYKSKFIKDILLKDSFEDYFWEANLRLTEGKKVKHIGESIYIRNRAYDESSSSNVLNFFLKEGWCISRNKDVFKAVKSLESTPKVSIIILTKNRYNYLKTCIESIEERSTYKNYEIIIVNHESDEEELLDYLSNTKHKVIEYKGKFNFSKMNNTAARQAEGEYLLFLNNDTKVITPEFLENMVGFAQLKEVGAVGAKLLYEDKTIQHAGILLKKDGAQNAFTGYRFDDTMYFNILNVDRSQYAVTGGCMLINKEKFDLVGGFKEGLPIDFNDVDICLKLIDKGLVNVICSSVCLYHFESISRGKDNFDAYGLWDAFYKEWGKYVNYDKYNDFIIKADLFSKKQNWLIRSVKDLLPKGSKVRIILSKVYHKFSI